MALKLAAEYAHSLSQQVRQQAQPHWGTSLQDDRDVKNIKAQYEHPTHNTQSGIALKAHRCKPLG